MLTCYCCLYRPGGGGKREIDRGGEGEEEASRLGALASFHRLDSSLHHEPERLVPESTRQQVILGSSCHLGRPYPGAALTPVQTRPATQKAATHTEGPRPARCPTRPALGTHGRLQTHRMALSPFPTPPVTALLTSPPPADPRRGDRLLPPESRFRHQRRPSVSLSTPSAHPRAPPKDLTQPEPGTGNRKRLVGLAAQRFISSIASDAFQYARARTAAGPGGGRTTTTTAAAPTTSATAAPTAGTSAAGAASSAATAPGTGAGAAGAPSAVPGTGKAKVSPAGSLRRTQDGTGPRKEPPSTPPDQGPKILTRSRLVYKTGPSTYRPHDGRPLCRPERVRRRRESRTVLPLGQTPPLGTRPRPRLQL